MIQELFIKKIFTAKDRAAFFDVEAAADKELMGVFLDTRHVRYSSSDAHDGMIPKMMDMVLGTQHVRHANADSLDGMVKKIRAERITAQNEVAQLNTKIRAIIGHDESESDTPTPTDYVNHLKRRSTYGGMHSWTELFQIAALSNLQAYKERFFFLGEAEIRDLHQLILSTMSFSILAEQLYQAEIELEKESETYSGIQKAGEIMFQQIFHSPGKMLSLILQMEYSRKWRLREAQVAMSQKMLASDISQRNGSGRPLVCQEIMGSGKTAAAILTAQQLCDGNRLVISMTTKELLGQTRDEFRTSFNRLGKSVITFNMEPFLYAEESFQAEREMAQVYENLMAAKKMGWPVMMTRDSFQLFIVLKTELLRKDRLDEWGKFTRRTYELAVKIENELYKHSTIFQDENDTLWNSAFSFIQAQGQLKPLPDIQTYHPVFMKRIHDRYIKHGGSKDVSLTDVQRAKAQWVLDDVRKLGVELSESDAQTLVAFIVNDFSDDDVSHIEEVLASSVKNRDAIAIIKLTHHYFKIGATSKYLRDFGPILGSSGEPELQMHDLVARPYAKVNIPYGETTHFKDIDLRVFLSFEMLLKQGLTEELFGEFIKGLAEDLSAGSYDYIELFDLLKAWMPSKYAQRDEDVKLVIEALSANKGKCETFFRRFNLKMNPDMITHFFLRYVQSQFEVQANYIQSLPWDMQDSFDSILAMSGTTKGRETWVDVEMRQNREAASLIAGLVAQTGHPSVKAFDESDEPSDILASISTGDEDSVVIDVGGMLTVLPRDAAQHIIDKHPDLKCVSYFEDDGQHHIGGNGEKRTLRLYMHPDTVGKDAKNPSATVSKVFAAPDISIEDFYQGLMRVREHIPWLMDIVSLGQESPHRIQVYIPRKMEADIREKLFLPAEHEIKVQDVEKYLKLEDERRQKSRVLDAALKQFRHCIHRVAKKATRDDDVHMREGTLDSEIIDARFESGLRHPADVPVRAQVVDPEKMMDREMTRLRDRFPQLFKKAENDMLAIKKKALALISGPVSLDGERVVVRQTQSSHQHQRSTKKESATESETQSVTVSGRLRPITDWDYSTARSQKFYSSPNVEWYPLGKKDDAKIRVTANFKCVFEEMSCEDDRQAFLDAHYALVHWDEDGKNPRFTIMSNEEAEQLTDVLQFDGSEKGAAKCMLLNLHDPLNFKYHTYSKEGDRVTHSDLLDPEFRLLVVKTKLFLGLPLSFEADDKMRTGNVDDEFSLLDPGDFSEEKLFWEILSRKAHSRDALGKYREKLKARVRKSGYHATFDSGVAAKQIRRATRMFDEIGAGG